jgi:hypothetical protein
LLKVAGRRLHVGRTFVGAHHELDLAAQHLPVIFEGRFAIAVVEQVGIKHRSLLGE